MDTLARLIGLATMAGLIGAALYNAEAITRLLRALTAGIAGGLRAVSR